MASAAGTPPGGMTSAGRAQRSRQGRRAASAHIPPRAAIAPPADPMASVPRLRGKLRAPYTRRAQREWATSPQRYSVRVGWRHARVSDNVADLLRLIDGSRTVAELAAQLGMRQDRFVHPAEVLYLLQRRLAPAGLVSFKASARSTAPAVAAPTRPAISSPVPTAPRAPRTVAAAPAAAITAPSALPAAPQASRVSTNPPRPASRTGAASAASAPPPDDLTTPTVPLAAPNGPEIPPPAPHRPAAKPAVTRPLPELAEAAPASPVSPVLPAAYVSPPPANAARVRVVDDAPTLPAIFWRETSAPATPPVATPPAAAAAQRALVPASVARPPVVSPPREVPARTGVPPPLRRPWTATAGRTAAGIIGLAFLLGALVAALSLDGQRPSFGFTQPGAARPTHMPASAPTPLRERIVPGEHAYAVKPGDTLAAIAGQYGISADALLIVNGDILPEASSLKSGMQLALPAVYNPSLAPTAQPRPLYYVVQRGDTLYDIGTFFGTTWNAIADYNHLADPRALDVGQGLLIPPNGP